jgi:hypothetical protein
MSAELSSGFVRDYFDGSNYPGRCKLIQAFVHGKLSREQENIEDLVTSTVFGLLSYLPPQVGILPFLAVSQSIEGARPLAFLADPSNLVTVEYEFWPHWQESECIGCEPDVVLRLQSQDGQKLMVLVEAKYQSVKSSYAESGDERPNDQLAREWNNLIQVANREHAEPYLVYFTAAIGVPRREIGAIAEFRKKRRSAKLPRLMALSWRQIPEVFGDAREPMLGDLCRLAQRLEFSFFRGFQYFDRAIHWSWTFDPIVKF